MEERGNYEIWRSDIWCRYRTKGEMTRKGGINQEKIVEKLDYDQYLVKVDGGGRITRRNRRYLKKIISTLADKEIVESKEINGGKQEGCRRSSRLVKGIRR